MFVLALCCLHLQRKQKVIFHEEPWMVAEQGARERSFMEQPLTMGHADGTSLRVQRTCLEVARCFTKQTSTMKLQHLHGVNPHKLVVFLGIERQPFLLKAMISLQWVLQWFCVCGVTYILRTPKTLDLRMHLYVLYYQTTVPVPVGEYSRGIQFLGMNLPWHSVHYDFNDQKRY